MQTKPDSKGGAQPEAARLMAYVHTYLESCPAPVIPAAPTPSSRTAASTKAIGTRTGRYGDTRLSSVGAQKLKTLGELK